MFRNIHAIKICCVFVLIPSLLIPAYAEIKSLKMDKKNYYRGEIIAFSGKAADSQLISLVIRDNQGKFVLLNQFMSNNDGSFSYKLDSKDLGFNEGEFHAYAFLLKEEDSVSTWFNFTPLYPLHYCTNTSHDVECYGSTRAIPRPLVTSQNMNVVLSEKMSLNDTVIGQYQKNEFASDSTNQLSFFMFGLVVGIICSATVFVTIFLLPKKLKKELV